MHARRVSAAPQLGGSPFLGTLYMVHTSCVSDTPFPGWGVSLASGGNGPHARRAQKGRDTYGFPSSLNSYLSLSDLANEPYGSIS